MYSARDAIVVTVPIGVLQQKHQNSTISFVPLLPSGVRNAIHNIGMGYSIKIFIRFNQIFWPVNATLLASVGPRNVSVPSFTLFWVAKTSVPMLVTAATGDLAKLMELWPKQKLQAHVLHSLRAMYGADVVNASFVGFRRTAWNNDQYSRGAYSYPKYQTRQHEHVTNHGGPGAGNDSSHDADHDAGHDAGGGGGGIDIASRATLQDVLGQNDTLYFAGEATSDDYYGTILGALLSAHRVAHGILYQRAKWLVSNDETFYNHISIVKSDNVNHEIDSLSSDDGDMLSLLVTNLDHKIQCHEINQNLVQMSTMNVLHHVILDDIPKLFMQHEQQQQQQHYYNDNCGSSFLQMFRQLISCGNALNTIILRDNGITSDDLILLSNVLQPPPFHFSDYDITSYSFCRLFNSNKNEQQQKKKKKKKKEKKNRNFWLNINNNPTTSMNVITPLTIDLSKNDIIIATDLIRAWLKWKRPSPSSLPASSSFMMTSALPILDLSENDISDQGAIEIAHILQEFDQQADKNTNLNNVKKKTSTDTSTSKNNVHEIIHTEENRNELLGCLFLHGNNIGEAGLYNLGQVSQSRWCITLHDNEERILQKRHCSCSRPPSRTEEINLPQQNSKLQQQQQQCILENSKSIVFGQLHGEDEWSNQLFAQVFNPVDNVAFEKEL